MSRKRKRAVDIVLWAPQLYELLSEFLDDKTLYAMSVANKEVYKKTQPVFRARFLRDCPAWPLSVFAKDIRITNTPWLYTCPSTRSWSSLYKTTKQMPLNEFGFREEPGALWPLIPRKTEFMFDVTIQDDDEDGAYSSISSGISCISETGDARFEIPHFTRVMPIWYKVDGKHNMLPLGFRMYIINQSLNFSQLFHVKKFTLGKQLCSGAYSCVFTSCNYTCFYPFKECHTCFSYEFDFENGVAACTTRCLARKNKPYASVTFNGHGEQ